jgi:tripartite-type tricarboxylate transporter receptor subunit TctC
MISRRSMIVASTLAPMLARAQGGNSLRVVVGFTAGGAADYIARQLAANIELEGFAAAIVDNRAGAAGRIAPEFVKGVGNDGKTVLVASTSVMTIPPFIYNKLNYDPVKDFQPVSLLCKVPYGICVGPRVPASVRTLKDFVQWLKDNPDDASFGTSGNGTATHFLGTVFGRLSGVKYVHVPYRGGALALQDVMAGQIASSANVTSELIGPAQAGKIRVLGVSSSQRDPHLPSTSSFVEAGYSQLDAQEWFGVFAPANMNPALVKALNQAAGKAFAKEQVKKVMFDIGYTTETSTPEGLAQVLKKDMERWGPIVKSTGFKADE